MSMKKVKTIKARSNEGRELDLTIAVNEPNHPEPTRITQADVWGKSSFSGDHRVFVRYSNGMIVARGNPTTRDPFDNTGPAVEGIPAPPEVCPVWGDKLPYKSVTVVCDEKDEAEVSYWLEYVHGGDSISRRKSLPGGKLALRSDYQCW